MRHKMRMRVEVDILYEEDEGGVGYMRRMRVEWDL
jgi:hypothetical protein